MTDGIDIQQLEDDLDEKARFATQGPWRWGNWSTIFGELETEPRLTLEANPIAGANDDCVVRHSGDGPLLVLRIEYAGKTDDAAYIAAVYPQAIRALITRSRALRTVEAERDALQIRQQELLATIVKLTNQIPYPEEANNAAVLIAEVGTLKAALAEMTRARDVEIAAHHANVRDLDAIIQRRNAEIKAAKLAKDEQDLLLERAVRLANRVRPHDDWACIECCPNSDILKAGFQCDVHALRAAAKPPQETQ